MEPSSVPASVLLSITLITYEVNGSRHQSLYIREITLKYYIIISQNNNTAILWFTMPWRSAL